MNITCKDCGKEFELTQGEIDFYKSKGLNLPKRCKNCRQKDKTPANNGKDTTKTPNTNKGKSSNKKIISLVAVIIIALLSVFGYFNKSIIDSPSVSDEELVSSVNKTEIVTLEQTSEDSAYENSSVVTTGFAETQSLQKTYSFRNNRLLTSHYEKHGIEMGFDSKESYQAAAVAVVTNPDALVKTEEEDGDLVYYIKSTGEIVFVSGDGYIRTYFISSLDYFNRQ